MRFLGIRRRSSIRAALAALASLSALAIGGSISANAQEAGGAAGSGGLQATLERLGGYVYAGDPVHVRVAVFNTGKEAYENLKGLDLLKGLVAGDATGVGSISRKQDAAGDRKHQPALLAPGGFFGYIVDLREMFEGLEKPGRLSVRLALEEVSSPPVLIAIIPRYDPKTAYRATLETEFGQVSFDLLARQAPHHVKNFYDLANQGFYDGSYFITMMKGVQMIGGDLTGDGRSSPGYDLPLEIQPGMKHARGTLSMLRKQETDHGAQFVVSLGDNPMLDGNLSIFGVGAGGDDTLLALENLPTTGRSEKPYYRPLKDVKILSARVVPATDGSKATAAEAGVTESAAP